MPKKAAAEKSHKPPALIVRFKKPGLHKRLKVLAAKSDEFRSMNEIVEKAVEEFLKGRKV